MDRFIVFWMAIKAVVMLIIPALYIMRVPRMRMWSGITIRTGLPLFKVVIAVPVMTLTWVEVMRYWVNIAKAKSLVLH